MSMLDDIAYTMLQAKDISYKVKVGLATQDEKDILFEYLKLACEPLPNLLKTQAG